MAEIKILRISKLKVGTKYYKNKISKVAIQTKIPRIPIPGIPQNMMIWFAKNLTFKFNHQKSIRRIWSVKKCDTLKNLVSKLPAVDNWEIYIIDRR